VYGVQEGGSTEPVPHTGLPLRRAPEWRTYIRSPGPIQTSATTLILYLLKLISDVAIKIRPVEFVLTPTTPKKTRNMSQIFWVGIFFS
jgi:hypothetical protein